MKQKHLALMLCVWLQLACAMSDENSMHNDENENLDDLLIKHTTLLDSPPPSPPALFSLELPAVDKKETFIFRLTSIKKEPLTPFDQTHDEYDHADQSYKKFDCSGCSKTFRTRKEKINHFLRMHQTEKQYACTTCGVAYSTQSSCLLHQKRKHGPLIYACNFCINKVFAMRCDRNQHIRRKHQILIGNCSD